MNRKSLPLFISETQNISLYSIHKHMISEIRKILTLILNFWQRIRRKRTQTIKERKAYTFNINTFTQN